MSGAARWALAWLLALTAFASGARGQDVSVRAEIEADRVFVGESFLYAIVVTGDGTEPGVVRFPDVPGLTVEELPPERSSSYSMRIVNGRRTETESRTTVLRWRLTPTRAGDFEIPGIGVEVAGKIYVAERAFVQATPPMETEDVRLRIETSRTSPFVGERVRTRFTMLIAGREARDLRFAVPEGDGALEFVPAPQANVSQIDLRAGRAVQVTINGRPTVGLVGSEVVEGREFTTLTFDVIMTARRAGAGSLGPATVAMDVVVARRRTNDLLLMSRPVTERLVVPSNAIALSVRALPTEGRPSGFNGLVGAYKVDVGATPTTVSVGDPITLTIAVRGPEPIEDAPMPDLEGHEELTSGFKLAAGGSPPRIEGGAKTIERVVRARSADVERVPPLGFWTFDPQQEAYVRAESRPVPVRVSPTSQFTLADGFDEEPPAPLESASAGLAANRVGARLLASQGFDLGEQMRRPLALAAFGAPAALGIGASALAVFRRRAQAAGPKSAARGSLRRALADLAAVTEPGHVSSAEEVSRIVRRYVGERLHRPTAGLTASDCAGLLRGAGVSEAGAVEELLHRCDLARFGGDAGEAARLRDEARALLGRVESAVAARGRGRAA